VTAASFSLEDQSKLLSVTELARALEVTVQTVYNYEKRGLAATVGPDGAKLWQLEKAREWIKTNGPSRVRGGKRPGAGAKPREERQKKAEDEGVQQQTLRSVFLAAEERMIALGMPAEAAKAAGEVDALITAVKDGVLTLAQIETVAEGLKAVKALLSVREQEGKLVSREEMRGIVGQHLTVVRRTLESVPGRAAPEIVAELGLPADKAPAIKRILADKIVVVMKQIEQDPLAEKKSD